ncbi:MAG: hypothetical protein ACYC1Q_08680 [Bacteroidia bacterium]
MTVVEIRNSLHLSIDRIDDESFLKAMYAMITSFANNEEVGFIGDKKLTRRDILNRELEADADIKAGRIHTIDQIKKSYGITK